MCDWMSHNPLPLEWYTEIGVVLMGIFFRGGAIASVRVMKSEEPRED